MAIEKVVSKVVNQTSFEIDSKSWKAMDRFQKRIKQIKEQLSGLNSKVTVTADKMAKKQLSAMDKVSNARKRTSRGNNPWLNENLSHIPYSKMSTNRGDTRLTDQYRKQEEAYRKKYMSDWSKAHQMNTKYDKERLKALLKREDIQQRISNNQLLLQERLQRNTSKVGAKQQSIYLEELRKIGERFKNNEISARKYRDEVSRLNRAVTQSVRNHKNLFERLTSIRALMVSGVAIAGATAIRDITATGQRFESLTAGLMIASGGLKEARQDMAWVNEIATELGANLEFATEGYMKMALAGKKTMGDSAMKELFQSFTEYATATGTNSFRYEKSIMAISQMLNKNQVMAEELDIRLGL